MKCLDTLRFLSSELKTAIENREHTRISELGTAVEVLFEAAKALGDETSASILDRMIYIVYHYRDADSFTEMNFDEITKGLTDE